MWFKFRLIKDNFLNYIRHISTQKLFPYVFLYVLDGSMDFDYFIIYHFNSQIKVLTISQIFLTNYFFPQESLHINSNENLYNKLHNYSSK